MPLIKKYVTAKFQLIVFSIVCLFVIALLYIPMHRFTLYDKKPYIEYGIPTGSTPSIIRASLIINSFSQFEMLKNDFDFEGKLSFEFEPDVISIEELEKFDINHGEILERSKPLISKHANKILVSYFIRAKFKTNLSFKSFPLDNHIIYLAFTNRYIDARKILFEPVVDHSTSQPDLQPTTCALTDIITESGYVVSTISLTQGKVESYYPEIIFGIKCPKNGLRRFVNIFLPLLLIFFFTLFAFSLDFKEHGQTVPTIAAAGIPALITYRFVIETISPSPEYFMLSDYLFFLFLFLEFAIFIVIVASIHSSEKIKQFTIISLYACMLVSCLVLFNLIL